MDVPVLWGPSEVTVRGMHCPGLAGMRLWQLSPQGKQSMWEGCPRLEGQGSIHAVCGNLLWICLQEYSVASPHLSLKTLRRPHLIFNNNLEKCSRYTTHRSILLHFLSTNFKSKDIIHENQSIIFPFIKTSRKNIPLNIFKCFLEMLAQ